MQAFNGATISHIDDFVTSSRGLPSAVREAEQTLFRTALLGEALKRNV
jgi:hypothetical protein